MALRRWLTRLKRSTHTVASLYLRITKLEAILAESRGCSASILVQRRLDDTYRPIDHHLRPSAEAAMKRPLLILLEGANDLEFLIRIAGRLQNDLPRIPDLGHLQAAG